MVPKMMASEKSVRHEPLIPHSVYANVFDVASSRCGRSAAPGDVATAELLAFFESEGAMIDEKLGEVRKESVKKAISSMLAGLSSGDKDDILKAL